jgi:hypothetical protein
LILEERKNLQTNYQFIQKLSLYFKQNVSFISSTNGLNCNSFQSNEIINQIINEDKNLNFDLLFQNIFLLNPQINNFIDLNELSKIKHNNDLETIQILLRILTKKRIKKFLINDFKLISSLDKSIISFKNTITKIINVILIKDKEDYPNFLLNSSCQVYKIIYDNGDIFYFKNTKKILKVSDPKRLLICSTLKNSQLRPSSLNLKDTYSKKQLITLIRLKLGKITNNAHIKQILLLILKSLNGQSKIEIPQLQQLFSNISIEDEKSIFRDFGEIIGAINFSNDNKIYFSKQNEKLIDFVIKNKDIKEFYSCKFSSSNKTSKGGSRSSLTIIKNYMDIFKDNLNKDEKELYDLLNIICETKGAFNSYEKVAKFLNIEDQCQKEFNDLQLNQKTHGKKTYLYAMNCKKKLNNSLYKQTLNSVLNKINIKQIYLIYDNKNTILFDVKNFNQSNFIFDSSVSINKFRSKLSFRMK